jgi:hypothetical protein
MMTPVRWRVELVKDKVDEVRRLAAVFQDEQVRRGDYTREEMDALTDPKAECSWSAPDDMQTAPWTFVARSDENPVIGGVEIYQQKRDRFWYLDMLVRDQAPAYEGVGLTVAREAIGWLMRETESGPHKYGVRVHAMERERRLVEWWSNEVLHMQPTIHDAFVRNGDHHFAAVGWIVRATPQQ